MELFLVSGKMYPSLREMRAALDLVKENGGKVKGIAPFNMGFIVETTPEIAYCLNFILWV